MMKSLAVRKIDHGPTVVEYNDNTPLITPVRPSANAGMDLYRRESFLSRIKFAMDLTIFLSMILVLCAESLYYYYLWPLPYPDDSKFFYPKPVITAIQLVGLVIFVSAGAIRVWYTESEFKSVWWLLYFGIIFANVESAYVFFEESVFVETLVTGTFALTKKHVAVYALGAIAIGMVFPALAIVDLYGPEMRRARYYRLMIIVGVFTKQISLIVTIHSVIVQVGFVLFVLGILLTITGYVLGLLERRNLRKYGLEEV